MNKDALQKHDWIPKKFRRFVQVLCAIALLAPNVRVAQTQAYNNPQDCIPPTQPVVELPNPETEHKIFLPFIRKAMPLYPGLGVAVADVPHAECDVPLLQAKWMYWWSEGCEYLPIDGVTCYNMVRELQLPIECYEVFLAGNELNLPEPYGADIPPEIAAAKLIALEAQCPNSTIVFGNISQDGLDWLLQFFDAYELQAGKKYQGPIGLHCYNRGTIYCDGILTNIRQAMLGAQQLNETWLTETSCLDCVPPELFHTWMDWATRNFRNVAVYTPRQAYVWPTFEDSHLIEADPLHPNYGQLNAKGQIYLEFAELLRPTILNDGNLKP